MWASILPTASDARTMDRDIRQAQLLEEAESLFRSIRQPATGLISDATEVSSSPDGKWVAFAGTIVDRLDGASPSRICLTELLSGETRVITLGPNTDRLPRFSPDGKRIAFLSDRHREGDLQLYLFDLETGAARPTPRVDGRVEYFHWAPDGTKILLGIASRGGRGAGMHGDLQDERPSRELWMPTVEMSDEAFCWRRAWIYDLDAQKVRQVSNAGTNVWDAVWCGNHELAAVVSDGPGEGLWYTATMHIIDLRGGDSRLTFAPKYQLGSPSCSPSGHFVAVVEAVCSDRKIVAGDLRIINSASGNVNYVETKGVDITYTEWRSDRVLLLAGYRGCETVVGLVDASTFTFRETWSSSVITSGGPFMISGLGEGGNFVMEGEGFTRAPEISIVQEGKYRTVRSFDAGFGAEAKEFHSTESVTWKARDGLEIQGWLLRPTTRAPHPLVLIVHGGPISLSRPTWGGRSVLIPMLLKHGYAVLLPNPRGSSGRGQEFARMVIGDVGGEETYDHLAAIDSLVAMGVIDPKRLGVMGGSYGGFMTSWLITQDPRFAAAASSSAVTNWVSEHLIGNIPHFCEL